MTGNQLGKGTNIRIVGATHQASVGHSPRAERLYAAVRNAVTNLKRSRKGAP